MDQVISGADVWGDLTGAMASMTTSSNVTATLLTGAKISAARGKNHAETEANVAKAAGKDAIKLHTDTLKEVHPDEETSSTITFAGGDKMELTHTKDCTPEYVAAEIGKRFGMTNLKLERTSDGFKETGHYMRDDLSSDEEEDDDMSMGTYAQDLVDFSQNHPETALKALFVGGDGHVHGLTEVRGTKARVLYGGRVDLSTTTSARVPKGVLHKVPVYVAKR